MENPMVARLNPFAMICFVASLLALPLLIVGVFSGFSSVRLLAVVLLLVAIVLGHIGLIRINRSKGAFRGKGFAIAGLCVSYSWILMGGVGAVVVTSSVSQMRETAQKTMCLNNLRQIVNASLLHAAENEERLPSALQELTEYIDDPRTFVIPCSDSDPGSLSEVNQWSDYTLVPNRSTLDSVDTVLAYCDPNCWGREGGHIAFLGGNVVWYQNEEFQERIAGAIGK